MNDSRRRAASGKVLSGAMIPPPVRSSLARFAALTSNRTGAILVARFWGVTLTMKLVFSLLIAGGLFALVGCQGGTKSGAGPVASNSASGRVLASVYRNDTVRVFGKNVLDGRLPSGTALYSIDSVYVESGTMQYPLSWGETATREGGSVTIRTASGQAVETLPGTAVIHVIKDGGIQAVFPGQPVPRQFEHATPIRVIAQPQKCRDSLGTARTVTLARIVAASLLRRQK